jgi:allantoicase
VTVTDFELLPDLAARSLGGGVVSASDELFAAADHLVLDHPPRFDPHSFGPKGQIYDGWESRRRRTPGHDHAIVRLGVPGVVRGVVVDTAFFTGNYPPEVSVEGCGLEGHPGPAELAAVTWVTVVPRSPVTGDSRTPFAVDVPTRFTHVRLSIYPDGGVARLRVHGEPVPDPRLFPGGLVDLAALENGGRVTGCSNMFYGVPSNLLKPGLARVMGEGWETARRRDTGNDWVEVALAAPGRILLAELDTTHFKGNAPGEAQLGGANGADAHWLELLARTRLRPDTRHRFPITVRAAVERVRMDVFPDGGMARLRLWGKPSIEAVELLVRRWFEALPEEQAARALADSGVPSMAGLIAALRAAWH